MNREEAIKFFELQTQDEQALIDGINLNPDDFVFGAEGPEQYINDCQNNIDAYETAISALRSPHPDPITGLVPCGCGRGGMNDIIAVSYKESRLEHFKAMREKRKKTLHWWKYQKPEKQYELRMILKMCSELGREIGYLDDVIEMLEKAGAEG